MAKKIWNSFIFSCQGFQSAFLKEYSFRLEILAIPFLLLGLYFLEISTFRKLVMIAMYLFIPCLELLNSAVEKLADRLTTEYDQMIKFVKDAASASVFLSVIITALIWIACICF